MKNAYLQQPQKLSKVMDLNMTPLAKFLEYSIITQKKKFRNEIVTV